LTHSLIDETSLRFLQSVYSIEHTRLIPDLGQFEFLGFGKALRAERPILLRRPFDPRKKEASDKLKKSLPLLDPSATGEEPAVESAEGPKITNL
jgi:hypothetical protein